MIESRIKYYFRNRDDIAAVFLFGSHANLKLIRFKTSMTQKVQDIDDP